jgi:hypothetical protein
LTGPTSLSSTAEGDLRHEKIIKEKNAIIQLKVAPLLLFSDPLGRQDEEIGELKAKMDQMSDEFGEMLRVSPFCISSLPAWHSPTTRRKLWRRCARGLRSPAGTLTAQTCPFSRGWRSSSTTDKAEEFHLVPSLSSRNNNDLSLDTCLSQGLLSV